MDEANHQLVGNGVIPFSCLALVNKCSEKVPKPIRSILAIGTLFSSTFLGHSIVDKMSGTHNKYKVSIADFLPDVDDWVLALSTVLKSPALYKLTAILCPITYSTLGIRTGCRQKDKKKKLDKII